MSFGITLTSTNTGFVKAGSKQSSVSVIDISGISGTTIYTVPTGKTLYISGINISISGVGIVPSDYMYLQCSGQKLCQYYPVAGGGNTLFSGAVVEFIPAGGVITKHYSLTGVANFSITLWGWVE